MVLARAIRGLVGVFGVASLAVAQLTWADVRSTGVAIRKYGRTLSGGAAEHGAFMMGASSHVAEWSIYSPVTPHTSSILGTDPVCATLPFDFAGDAAVLSNSLVAFSGAESSTGDGWIVCVSYTGDAFGGRSAAVAWATNYGPTLDPISLAWSAVSQTLFVIDYRQAQLMVAPWDGLSAPPPLSAFAPVATGVLLEEPSMEMVPSPTGGVEITTDPLSGVRLLVEPDGLGGWATTTPAFEHGELQVHNLDHLAAGEDVFVRSNAPGTFALEDAATGAVLFTGSWSTPLSWATIPGSHFVANRAYRFRVNGNLMLALAVPNKRWGNFSATPGSPVICGRGYFSSPGPRIGNLDFGLMGWTALRNPMGASPEQAFVVLLLGLDNGGPVVLGGSGLTPMANPLVIWGPWPFVLTEDDSVARFRYDHPVPLDPALVGLAPIYQWVSVTTGGAIAASDVFGMVVFQ